VKKEKRRAKRRAEKERGTAAEKEEGKPHVAAVDGEGGGWGRKVDEKKRKRQTREGTSSRAVYDGTVAAMVKGHLFCSREA
jgi:hypothetical protein